MGHKNKFHCSWQNISCRTCRDSQLPRVFGVICDMSPFQTELSHNTGKQTVPGLIWLMFLATLNKIICNFFYPKYCTNDNSAKITFFQIPHIRLLILPTSLHSVLLSTVSIGTVRNLFHAEVWQFVILCYTDRIPTDAVLLGSCLPALRLEFFGSNTRSTGPRTITKSTVNTAWKYPLNRLPSHVEFDF